MLLKKRRESFNRFTFWSHGNVLSSQGAIPQLLSACWSLTSVFGMGTGVSFKPSSPHSLSFRTRACALKTKSYLSLPINLTAPWLSPRPISNGPLHASRHFHFHPIYLIISEGSYFPEGNGKSHLEASFTLRCFQRLSRPYIATQRCSWRNNWYTSGMSIPVLSY